MIQLRILNHNVGTLQLEDDISIPITKGISDIRDISVRRGAYSKTVKVPGTKQNNIILSNLFEVNGTSNEHIKLYGSLIKNGVIIAENLVVQINQVTVSSKTVDQDEKVYYEVSFRDNVADFFSLLKDKNLKDLVIAGTVTLTPANIIASWSNTYQDGYKFLTGTCPGPALGYPKVYMVQDYYPAFYARTYLDKIFESIQMTYTWSDMPSYFNKLILPYNGSKHDNYIYNISKKLSDFQINMTQQDFIKGLTGMFNLYFENDPLDSRNIIIMSRDTFYNSGTIKNWDGLAVKESNKEIKFISNEAGKKLILSYSEDSDIANKGYKDLVKEVYGEVEYVFDTQYTDELKRKEIPFAPTPFTKESFGAWTNLYSGNDPKMKPRILYDAGPTACDPYVLHSNGLGYNVTFPYTEEANQTIVNYYDEGGYYAFTIPGHGMVSGDYIRYQGATGPSVAYGIVTSNTYDVIVTDIAYATLAPTSGVDTVNRRTWEPVYTEYSNPAGSTFSVGTYNLAIHQDDPVTPTLDLNYGVCEFYFHDDINFTNNNLTTGYWLSTLGQLNDGILCTQEFLIDEYEWSKIKLNDKIEFDGCYWFINQIIDFDASVKRPTKVELIKADVLLPTFPKKTTVAPDPVQSASVMRQISANSAPKIEVKTYLALISQNDLIAPTNSGTMLSGQVWKLSGAAHPGDYTIIDTFEHLSGTLYANGSTYRVQDDTPFSFSSTAFQYDGRPYVVSKLNSGISPFINTLDFQIDFDYVNIGEYRISGTFDKAKTIINIPNSNERDIQPTEITFSVYIGSSKSDNILYYTPIEINIYQ